MSELDAGNRRKRAITKLVCHQPVIPLCKKLWGKDALPHYCHNLHQDGAFSSFGTARSTDKLGNAGCWERASITWDVASLVDLRSRTGTPCTHFRNRDKWAVTARGRCPEGMNAWLRVAHGALQKS